jgi:hypothetical protein
MSSNVNPETGIRYGIISANGLDPEVVNDIQMNGKDVHWDEFVAQVRADVMREVENGDMDESEAEFEIDERMDYDRSCFDDEPVHEFDIECPGYGRVKGRTTWLGGALMVWIFESPFVVSAKLCSPCVPNCGNLDDVGPFGYGEECYDVPADWRDQ